MRRWMTVGLLLAGAMPALAQESDAPEPVRAEQYMAVAANPHASRAGLEILRAGGSAADAAIAMQMVLGLVEPQSSGIGGGGFLLHYGAADGALIAYDGRETAPMAADETLFLTDDGEPMDYVDAAFGGRAVGTPGNLAMLEMVHADQGKLPWARLFAPAIRLAEEGFAISPRLHELLDGRAEFFRERMELAFDDLGPAGRYFFTPDLQAKAAGTVLKNPAYADSLRRIAKAGAAALYSGPLADEIIAAVRDNPFAPGLLEADDLTAYAPRRVAAVCGPYRDHRICSMGPPSSGATTMLATLGVLEGFDLGAMDVQSAEAVHLFAGASRLAYADRELYIGDDAFVSVPVEGLIDPAYLARRRALIGLDAAMESAPAGTPPQEHGALDYAPHQGRELPATSHLVVADAAGNVVSFTTTVQIAFGSFVMAGGFLLNNELTDFSFAPEQDGRKVANRVGPGKKPRSSMTPTIGFDDAGRPAFAIGSPGGSRIINYVTKAVMGLVDWRLDIQQAISLPNMTGRNATIELEQDTPLADRQAALEAMGHSVELRSLNSGLHGLTIHYRPDGARSHLTGGADPRREGLPLGD